MSDLADAPGVAGRACLIPDATVQGPIDRPYPGPSAMTGSGWPLVSVAIAAYNRAHLIGRTLDSLLRQTVRDLEIVISDDASDDGTREVCECYVVKDARVRYSRNPQRLGIAGNCSRVLTLTRGEFVVLAGDDDLYEPEFVRRLLDEMRRFPSAAIVAGRVDMIDQHDAYLRPMPQQFAAAPLRSPLRSANRMMWRGYGNLMTGMYRRDVLMRTSLYRSARRDYWEFLDLLFLFDMSLRGDVVTIPNVLLHKRVDGASSRPSVRSVGEMLATWVAISRGYAERIRGSDLPRWQKLMLRASLLLRMPVVLWQWKLDFAYWLLVALDPQRRVRRQLRDALPERFVKWLQADAC